MDLEELRKLTQTGKKNLEKEVLQYCDPSQIARILIKKLEIEAKKVAKEGGNSARARYIIWGTLKDGSDWDGVEYKKKSSFQKYNQGPLHKIEDYLKRVELSEVLFGIVKDEIADNNIKVTFDEENLSFCNRQCIYVDIEW